LQSKKNELLKDDFTMHYFHLIRIFRQEAHVVFQSFLKQHRLSQSLWQMQTKKASPAFLNYTHDFNLGEKGKSQGSPSLFGILQKANLHFLLEKSIKTATRKFNK
jgi:AraC-like DNA-binding protein